VAKITFTSGTTGEPKGVMLSVTQMERVATSLAEHVPTTAGDRHLCISPFAVLLENIAGLYAPLVAGRTCYLATPAESGLAGAAGIDGRCLAAALAQPRVASAILTPASCRRWWRRWSRARPSPRTCASWRWAAPQSPRRDSVAPRPLCLPVYEGYGLSECGSVVCLNIPAAHRAGSVGRPLPPLTVRTRATGEVEVRGHGFLGYLGEPGPPPGEWLATGELGPDGFLYLTGRQRSCFITAFGRNVAPEGVERELVLQPAIAQAVAFGEGQPWNAAVIVPTPGATEPEVVRAAWGYFRIRTRHGRGFAARSATRCG